MSPDLTKASLDAQNRQFHSGADPGFPEWGSESGAKPSIVSLKQGSGGAPPMDVMGYLILLSAKIPYNARLESFTAKFIRFSNLNGVN